MKPRCNIVEVKGEYASPRLRLAGTQTLLTLVGVGAAVAYCGCKDTKQGFRSHAPSQMVGNWFLDKSIVANDSQKLKTYFMKVGFNEKINLQANGLATFTVTALGSDSLRKGTWELQKTLLDLKINDVDGKRKELLYEVSGDGKSFQSSTDQGVYRFIKRET